MSKIHAKASGLIRVGLLALGLAVAAAAHAAPVGDLDPDEQAVVEALAQYDAPLRAHALVAASEADVLGALVAQQQRSSDTFRRLLEPYDRNTQEDLYELARYPALVSELVEGGAKTQEELDAIAFRYPEAVAQAAARSGVEHWKLIARTDALLREEQAVFEDSIAHLSGVEQDAFRTLLGAPDLLALLAENTGVVVLLGDAYEREPDAVVAWLDEVSTDATRRGREETETLARSVEEDPELAEEVATAAAEYESETGEPAYVEPSAPHHHHTHDDLHPYPYWVGHPWWYATAYAHYDPWYWWYPRVSWSVGGVSFGPRFQFGVSVGWPHGAFWGWYFGRPSHHQRYARVTHHVVRHYERAYPRRFERRPFRRYHRVRARHARVGGHAVHRFVRDARRDLPRGFLDRDGRRIERLRDYGKRHDRRRDRDLRRGRRDRDVDRGPRRDGVRRVAYDRRDRRDRNGRWELWRRDGDREDRRDRADQRRDRGERRDRADRRRDRDERRDRADRRRDRDERRERADRDRDRGERRERADRGRERGERRDRVERRPERGERAEARRGRSATRLEEARERAQTRRSERRAKVETRRNELRQRADTSRAQRRERTERRRTEARNRVETRRTERRESRRVERPRTERRERQRVDRASRAKRSERVDRGSERRSKRVDRSSRSSSRGERGNRRSNRGGRRG